MAQAEKDFDLYLKQIQAHEKRLEAAQSLKTLENEAARIKNLDCNCGFLSKWIRSLEDITTQCIEQYEKRKKTFHNCRSSSNEELEKSVQEQFASRLEVLGCKAGEMKQQQEQRLTEFKQRVENEVKISLLVII